MFIGISYDGRVSLNAQPVKHLADNVYLDPYGGLVIEINDSGMPSYYNASYDSEYERGKIKSIGRTDFEYYRMSYDSRYELGRVKKIGSTYIEYYRMSYDSEHELGKVKKINSVYVEYYRMSYDRDYELGKPKKVGNVYFEYDSYGNLKRMS